ncbi:MAG: hypothetical protein QXQ02_00125 [Halobacteria archaeon]
MNSLFVFVLFSGVTIVPASDFFPPDVEVECLELNTVWRVDFNPNRDPKYKLEKCIEQTIGWCWDKRGFVWADWWVWGHAEPIRKQNGYWITWVRSANMPAVRVKARHYKITHTWYDPEVLDRENVAEENRIGLYPWKYVMKK